MNFTDGVFVRLADASTREAVFDQTALEQIASAAYDTSGLGLEGPFAAIFEDVQVGFYAPRLGTVEGYWGRTGTSERTEAAFHLAGLASTDVDVRIDAFWRGAIVARVAPPSSLIDAVESTWVSTNGGGTHTATVQVGFSAPTSAAAEPRRLPVAVALLIREAGFSVAQLVADTKIARDRLTPLGLERGTDPALQPHANPVVAWIVPEAVFEDAGWGGATDGDPAELLAQRRAFTGRWLAREGIGLIATT